MCGASPLQRLDTVATGGVGLLQRRGNRQVAGAAKGVKKMKANRTLRVMRAHKGIVASQLKQAVKYDDAAEAEHLSKVLAAIEKEIEQYTAQAVR